MQAGDPCGLFQHGAPFLWPGGDDGGDPPLADQRRAVRTGGGVGEDQRHILGAHILAIGAIGAARAAFDPARDFQFAIGADIDRVEQLALFLDGQQRYFGKVALRPAGGAGEDHILHAAAAHRLGAGFAHHPADRFQEVGFAAAIGPDNAGQARLDAQFGRIDEALEARKLEPLYLHGETPGQGAAPVSLGLRPSDVAPPCANQIPASLSLFFSTGQDEAFSTTTPFIRKVGVPEILYWALAASTPLASFSAVAVSARHCLA